MLCFRRNLVRSNAFATYLGLLVFLKLAFQDLLLWAPLFVSGCITSLWRDFPSFCFPLLFLGYLFRVAPRERPRVPDAQYLAATAFFILPSMFPTFSLELGTSRAVSS